MLWQRCQRHTRIYIRAPYSYTIRDGVALLFCIEWTRRFYSRIDSSQSARERFAVSHSIGKDQGPCVKICNMQSCSFYTQTESIYLRNKKERVSGGLVLHKAIEPAAKALCEYDHHKAGSQSQSNESRHTHKVPAILYVRFGTPEHP